MMPYQGRARLRSLAIAFAIASGSSGLLSAQDSTDFPPFEKVTEGFQKVQSGSPDKSQSLGNIYTRDKDGQMFIELPKDFASKKYFVALTVSSGDRMAGLQANDYYAYWRVYNKRLALILPNMDIRSNGEEESKASVKRLFTDTVLLDVPIVTMVPRGGPLIDGDALLVGQASKLFGGAVRVSDPGLVKIAKAKAFSKNIEIAYEVVGQGGKLQTIHYSLSEVPEQSGYKPRKADQRVGYFTTGFQDLGNYDDEKTRVRYINRWRLEKRDPSLKVSPPVTPIKFYIEHTTPVRYRRWVKQGIEYWNKAFEAIGFSDAIEVVYQDARTGANMELDPEDVQYNFVRWLNNDVGTAIGPSRVHPLTGEILDADIILTDGWIRHFNFQFHDLMPEIATEGMSAETLAWLTQHPDWDPRVRMAAPGNRSHIMKSISAKASLPFAGHPMAATVSRLLGDDAMDGLIGRTSQVNGNCLAAHGMQHDMAMARMSLGLLEMLDAEGIDALQDGDKKDEKKEGDKKEEPKKADKPKEDLLDGMPESFIGPLLAELVAHEAGHTLGLRHNFKASSVYTLAQINSNEIKGKKTLASSVMDYIPINIPHEVGETKGDWTMIGVGPYDMWAIEYGYTPDEAKLPELVKRVSEPELQYATDEDTGGADPLARRYDYSKDPLDFAENQMRLVKLYRDRLIEKFVKKGDSWSKARRGYELTLGEQTKAISMMANWVGGSTSNRDKKGDPGDRKSTVPVPVEQQRKAMDFVIRNAFSDNAFGLTPSILERMSAEKWIDEGSRAIGDGAFPVHDRVLAIQASALTMLMNPSTLRRVYDNEQVIPADQDALTLPEVMEKVSAAVWSEVGAKAEGEATSRKPKISSLRRNLQREHLSRLIDLAVLTDGNAAQDTIKTLAMMQLKDLKRKIDGALDGGKGLDPYSAAHLADAQTVITKLLDSNFIYNMPKNFGGGGGGGGFFFLGSEKEANAILRDEIPSLPEAPVSPALPVEPESK